MILFGQVARFGLFSVTSYGVTQRTNEFGILALGSTPRGRRPPGDRVDDLGTCRRLGESARRADGSAQSPLVFAGVMLLLAATSVLATVIPARRAAVVDPMTALRCD